MDGTRAATSPLLTIGELARRTGLPVRTIRYWSETGVVLEASRSEGGHRLYDPAGLARLELVATLRERGLSLLGGPGPERLPDPPCDADRRPTLIGGPP
jgi:hypothetical protein